MFVLFAWSASPRFVLQLSCHMLFLMLLSVSLLEGPIFFPKGAQLFRGLGVLPLWFQSIGARFALLAGWSFWGLFCAVWGSMCCHAVCCHF